MYAKLCKKERRAECQEKREKQWNFLHKKRKKHTFNAQLRHNVIKTRLTRGLERSRWSQKPFPTPQLNNTNLQFQDNEARVECVSLLSLAWVWVTHDFSQFLCWLSNRMNVECCVSLFLVTCTIYNARNANLEAEGDGKQIYSRANKMLKFNLISSSQSLRARENLSNSPSCNERARNLDVDGWKSWRFSLFLSVFSDEESSRWSSEEGGGRLTQIMDDTSEARNFNLHLIHVLSHLDWASKRASERTRKKTFTARRGKAKSHDQLKIL